MKKIVGILICMLLIGTGVVTCTSGNTDENTAPAAPDCFYNWMNQTLCVWSVDPESDPVRYGIEWWGSSTVDLWTDYYDSGVKVHIDVSGQGETVDVFAEDINGARSPKVNTKTLSKGKIEYPTFYKFFEKFFEHFPLLEKILNQITSISN